MNPSTRRVLVLVGIVVLAFNLRPAAVSIGPVLGDLRRDLDMSGAEAGVLTSLPVVAFALFGSVAARLARAVGPHRLTLAALLAVVVGLAARTQVTSVVVFLALSLLALAGMATANVVLPSLVKRHFPTRIGAMTTAYSTALAIGLTCSSVLTVPIGMALGGWRDGLMLWAVTAAVAALPWLGLMTEDSGARAGTPVEPEAHVGLGQVARTRLGWMMALFFGLQSLEAYSIFGWFAVIFRDAGFSSATAGLLLGVITATSIPTSLVVPVLAARLRDVRGLVVTFFACYVAGYVGLMVAPVGGAWLWAVLIGLGTASFPLALTLIVLRARTAGGTAALSGFTQSAGYLVAAPGPFLVGFLHDLTDGWTVPLLALTLLTVPLLLTGLAVGRTAYIEDELAPRVGADA